MTRYHSHFIWFCTVGTTISIGQSNPDRPGGGRVDLGTGSDFRVGAQLSGSGPGRGKMVVGGLLRRRSDEPGSLFLGVHNQGAWEEFEGHVRVKECMGEGRAGDWGDGFLLGRLVQETIEGGLVLRRVRPVKDLAHGLYRVVLLAPPVESEPAEVDLEAPTYEPACWRGAEALTRGTEVEPGSAVAFGPHLLGLVETAGSYTARVRTLSDPGLVLSLLARVEGERHPAAIGRVTTEGLGPNGTLRVRWEARVGIGGGGGPVSARLFTGGGVRGVPRGLLVGSARLPRTTGVHELLIQPGTDGANCQWVEVWIGPGAEVGG